MKALKAARKAYDAHEDAVLKKALWERFVRGLRCPYCGSPKGTPVALERHMDCCRRKMRRVERGTPPPDPDFPTLGKPIKGTMRWAELRKRGISWT